MSKFFTWLSAPLLAPASLLLASEAMPLPVPPPVRENPEPTASAAVGLPVALAAGRFASLGKKSPFTLASTTEENADFAKDLILAGYFRMDGQDFVMVANKTRPERLMVGTKLSPGAQGMVLLKVERDPSGDPTKLRAQIRKGSETAFLRYEASGVAAQAAPAQAVPGQGAPGQPPGTALAPAVQAAPGGPAPKQNPPVIRRRVIPIPSGPAR